MGHTAYMGQKRNAYKISDIKSKRIRLFWSPSVNGRITLKCILKNR
jgi:hypothetical protein